LSTSTTCLHSHLVFGQTNSQKSASQFSVAGHRILANYFSITRIINIHNYCPSQLHNLNSNRHRLRSTNNKSNQCICLLNGKLLWKIKLQTNFSCLFSLVGGSVGVVGGGSVGGIGDWGWSINSGDYDSNSKWW